MRTARSTTGQDVVDLLAEQHEQIKALLVGIPATTGPGKLALFEGLVRALAVHESAEEQVIHPAARRGVGDAVIDARLQEESATKNMLIGIMDLGTDHPGFDAAFAMFAADVIAHATREESDEFIALRDLYTRDELRRLAGAVRAAQAVAPTRAHPATGESAMANAVTGPLLAVFDRARDAARDVGRQIRAWPSHESVPARTETPPTPAPRTRPRWKRMLVSGAAGTAATVLMSGWMLAGGAISPHGEQAPKRVTRGLARRGGVPTAPHSPATMLSTGIAHLGFGITTGALYGAAAPRSTMTRGITYALGVWATSYAGWIPALGILPPPQKDRPARQITVLTAHIVYGAVLGAIIAAYDKAARRPMTSP